MSNIGQAVLTIGGAIVGSFFGNPQLGLLLGNLAGSALFPTDLGKVSGPKLDDLKVQSSAIGVPVPLVYGTYTVAGNIIWSTDLIPTTTTEEVGGKGGPTQKVETTTYSVSFAVGLCGRQIIGVRRIWAGGKLIYDRRPQLPGEDSTTYAARLNAADLFDVGMALYLGTEDQDPDPTIETYEGVGNVPGYRGLAYAVLTDFQLADYGNNLAGTALRWELVTVGGPEIETITEYEQQVVFPWENSIADPYSARNNHRIGQTFNEVTPNGVLYDTLGEAIAAAQAAAGFVGFYIDGSSYDGGSGSVAIRFLRTSLTGGPADPLQSSEAVGQWYGVAQPSGTGTLHWFYNDMNGGSGTAATRFAAELSGMDVGDIVFVCGLPNGVANNNSAATFEKFADSPGTFDGNGYWRGTGCYLIHGSRAPRAPDDPCNPQGLPAYPTDDKYPGFCIIGDELVESETWDENTSFFTGEAAGLQLALQRTDEGFSASVGPVLRNDDPNFSSSTFWQARYAEAVAAGNMPSGLTYGVDYPSPILSGNPYYSRTVERGTLNIGPTTLKEIVADLCLRADPRLAGLIDVTDLTKEIDGYAVGSAIDGAAAIQPLRPFGFFDAVESQGLLKFVTRGKAAIATLLPENLAAHISGGERPATVDVSRKNGDEIPRTALVRYAMLDKDYEEGQQPASRRVGSSRQSLTLELPIAMSDDEAARIADVTLWEAWAARHEYGLSIGRRWPQIEPTDCINVHIGPIVERLRVVGETYDLPGVRRLEAVRDDENVYDSIATGAAALAPDGTIRILDETLAYYLDLPALRDADDDPGYYAATRQDGANSWGGAQLQRSIDGGASFSSIGSVVNQATTGVLTGALPAGPTTIFDEGNTLQVTLDRGTLASATEAAVLAGANAAAIGAHGRWEIVQFRTAVLASGTTWNLSGLLRGRRGTEHAVGTSQVADRFVLISGAGIVRAPLDIAGIGVQRPHKAVTFGMALDSSDPVDFTGNAEALKPFSPVSVAGTRDGSSNLTITWIRRGRLGQELPSGTDIPLSEESEAYDVDILDGATVVRTLTASAQTVAYSAADQTTDFGSPQAAVDVRVYQRSAIVGRGYPAEASV